MADKLRDQQLLEALQARFIGLGSADTTASEWRANIARDTNASIVGHPAMLTYVSIGMGECRERARLALIERMVRPNKVPTPKKIANVEEFKLPKDVKKAVPVREPEIRDAFLIVKVDTDDEMETDDER